MQSITELVSEEILVEIVERAGQAILEIYATDFQVSNKDDASPLTQADLAAHDIIVEALNQATDLPVLSEESNPASYVQRSGWKRYWLVDPLDGTKEFVNKNGEFTVNIALIDGGRAMYGIVGVPVQGRIFTGDVYRGEAKLLENGAAKLIAGRAMPGPDAQMAVVASRSHGSERLERYFDELESRVAGMTRKSVGSSLKLCTLAEGGADCYPRLSPTSEWDIAAAHAVLTAAGGEVYDFQRKVLAYNSKDSLLNPEFVAVADAQYPWWDLLPEPPA